jgi:hypothetical protein
LIGQVKDHLAGVLRGFKCGLANGLLDDLQEGICLQAAKPKARGYRTIRNLVALVCHNAGSLKFDLTPAGKQRGSPSQRILRVSGCRPEAPSALYVSLVGLG